ncbi:MAG TPA: hypothetical protein VFV10_15205, partial [Gammaproteobacteria bacterium]|nr:hypothetical protein [Gammaproteobacteria bacterium]
RVPAPSSGEPPAPQAGVATAQSPSVGVAPPPAPPPGAAGPVLAYTVVSPGNAGAEPARTEDLGDEVIEGVLAHGTRVTHTIPVGAIGNELPIDVVSESWYSSELDEVVMSKFSDPRIGETTYRLENLVREEPAPDLFTVPSDYKLVAEDVPSPGAWADQNGSPGTRVERRVFIAPPNAASH